MMKKTGNELIASLTIRDYFAAKAMQGLLVYGDKSIPDTIACSVQLADRLINELNKDTNEKKD
jgi:hypothetical protein